MWGPGQFSRRNCALTHHFPNGKNENEPAYSLLNTLSFTKDWAFLNMDDISQLNLRVLKRHNPYITSLIDKSSYCVIYTFSTTTESWTKAGYEGTLFIYTQQPHTIQTEYAEEEGGEYGFCVLNRLNLENFWGEINGGDIVLEDQYIITRSLTGDVFGLWLFEEADRPRIYNLLDQLNSKSRISHISARQPPPLEEPVPTNPHIDINSLFNRSTPLPREEEPLAEHLPSVDRLTQLFSRAMIMQEQSVK